MIRVIFLMQDRIRWACPIGQLESMHQVMNGLELLTHEKSHHHLPPSWGLQWQEFQPTLGTGLSLLCVRHLVKMPMKKVSSSLLKQKKPGPRWKKKKNLIPKVSIAWATIAADLVSQTQWTFPLLSPQNVHGRPFLNTSINQHQFLLTIKTMSHPWAGSESGSVVFNSSLHNRLYSPWNSPGQNTGVGGHSLLQGIFPTQGYNPDLPHCRQIPFFFSSFLFLLLFWFFKLIYFNGKLITIL